MAKYDNLILEQRDIKFIKTPYAQELYRVGTLNKYMAASPDEYVTIADAYFLFGEKVLEVAPFVEVRVGKEWKRANNIDELAAVYGMSPVAEEVVVETPVVENTPYVEEVATAPVVEETPYVEEAVDAPVVEETSEEEIEEETAPVDEANKKVAEPIGNTSKKKKKNKKSINVN